MWILTGNECRCDTLRWGFEFRVKQHLLECDLWRVLHSCLHSIGVRIVIRRVGTVHGAISSAPTSGGERLEDSSNPLIYSQDWNLGRFTLLLAILGREYSQLHFRLAQLRSCRRTFGSDVSSFLTGSSSDDPSPQRKVVEAYWIDLESSGGRLRVSVEAVV